MVRPVETIRREIDSLNEATVTLAAEFSRLYTGYLDSVGLALRRQVVMATYHLCTQVYPEGFLAISVRQREKLQRDIRHLGQQGNTWLQELLEPPPAEAEASPTQPPGQIVLELPALAGAVEPPINIFAAAPEKAPEQDALADTKADWDSPPSADQLAVHGLTAEESGVDAVKAAAQREAEDPRETEDTEEVPLPSLLKSMVLAALAEEMGEPFNEPLFTGEDMTPTRLAKQHIFLEQRIRDVLQRVSKQANHVLQAAQVIPNLPDAVLDAASETEVGPSRGRSVPNVLSVLVAMASDMDVDEPLDREDEDDDDEEDRDLEVMEEELEEEEDEPREGMMTHLAAINLRLSDLEFGDVQSSMWRSKLRAALGHLRKLGKQYQKAQREMAIAEAEQAWRAVWYDDSPR